MIWPFTRRPALADARPLYAALVAEARRTGWYTDAGVPDTMDGRFAVLATAIASADLRLGGGGDVARDLAPRLTECFVADMDAQLQQAGLGDPTLGREVRKLVAVLADKIARLGDPNDRVAVRRAVYADGAPSSAQLDHAVAMVDDLRRRLADSRDEALAEGAIA